MIQQKNYIQRQQQKHLMHGLNGFKVNGKVTRTVLFYSPCKHQKAMSFLMFSGVIEWYYCGTFIVSFEHIQNINFVFLSLTLNLYLLRDRLQISRLILSEFKRIN